MISQKKWGDKYMGVPPDQNLGGDASPPVDTPLIAIFIVTATRRDVNNRLVD